MFFLYWHSSLLGIDIPGPGEIVRSLGTLIIRFIFWLMTSIYDLFMNVSRVQFLQARNIQPIYNKVTLVLTIVMVFYVTFHTIKYVLEPDKMGDKEQGAGKIVLRMILVVVLIAMVPKIFELGYKAQGIILESGIFEKVIFSNQTNVDVTNYGHSFAADLLEIFYYVEDGMENEDCETPEGGISPDTCENVVNANINELRTTGNISNLDQGIWEPESGKAYIGFDWLLGTLVGGFICYMLIMYTIDAGARVAQLAFLQIIAPIPIIGYISPKKDNMFEKWVKQCTTTYIDLFIRVAIIYVVLLLSKILGEALKDGTLVNGLDNQSWLMEKFVYLALIIGLFTFAQRAPKMIQELMPSSGSKAAAGDFGLDYKKRNLPAFGRAVGGAVGGAAGAITGLATGVAQGRRKRKYLEGLGANKKRQRWGAISGGIHGGLKGAAGGLARGAYGGSRKGNMFKNISKGAKNQIEKNKQFGARQEHGYTLKHQITDRITETFGIQTRIEKLEAQKKPIEAHIKINNDIFDLNKQIKAEAKKHVIEEGKGRYSAAYKLAEQRVHDLKENADKLGYKAGGTVEGVTFATQGEANVALSKAQAKAASELDAVEKKAVYDFIDNGEWNEAEQKYIGRDQQVINLQNKLMNTVKEYNETSTHDHKTPSMQFVYDEATHKQEIVIPGLRVERDADGKLKLEEDPTATAHLTAEEFNKYTKMLTERNTSAESGSLGAEITRLNYEITNAKSETEGGFGSSGGKK